MTTEMWVCMSANPGRRNAPAASIRVADSGGVVVADGPTDSMSPPRTMTVIPICTASPTMEMSEAFSMATRLAAGGGGGGGGGGVVVVSAGGWLGDGCESPHEVVASAAMASRVRRFRAGIEMALSRRRAMKS